MDVANIWNLFSEFDRKKIVLPLFVAGSLERVPGVCPLERDVGGFFCQLSEFKASDAVCTEITSELFIKYDL